MRKKLDIVINAMKGAQNKKIIDIKISTIKKNLLSVTIIFLIIILIALSDFDGIKWEGNGWEILTSTATLGAVIVALALPFILEERRERHKRKRIKSLLAIELYSVFRAFMGPTIELDFDLVGEKKLKENAELFKFIDESLFELYVDIRHYIYAWQHMLEEDPATGSVIVKGKHQLFQIKEKRFQILMKFHKIFDDTYDGDTLVSIVSWKMSHFNVVGLYDIDGRDYLRSITNLHQKVKYDLDEDALPKYNGLLSQNRSDLVQKFLNWVSEDEVFNLAREDFEKKIDESVY